MRKANLRIPQLTDQQIKRFWDKVDIRQKRECWCWTWGTKKGYGRVGLNGNIYYAHRVAYALTFTDPGELLACHHCDNPTCCNPHHIFLGTDDDNSKDAIKKERTAKGEKSGMRKHPERIARGEGKKHKLTEAQVREIKRRCARCRACGHWKMSFSRIAREYKVAPVTIQSIMQGRKWRHVK